MRQQVSHAEHGVARVLADGHRHHRAVGLRHHAVQCKRQCHPLVVLDAAVIVRVEQREAARLVVCAEDVHAVGKRLGAQLHEDDRLAVRGRPHLVARLERAPFAHRLVKRLVARFLGKRDRRRRAFAFGLVFGDEVDVAARQRIDRGKVLLAVLLPRHVAFHKPSFHAPCGCRAFGGVPYHLWAHRLSEARRMPAPCSCLPQSIMRFRQNAMPRRIKTAQMGDAGGGAAIQLHSTDKACVQRHAVPRAPTPRPRIAPRAFRALQRTPPGAFCASSRQRNAALPPARLGRRGAGTFHCESSAHAEFRRGICLRGFPDGGKVGSAEFVTFFVTN